MFECNNKIKSKKMEKIYLLDLNYTLAESISMSMYFTYNVSKDVYRKDLVKALKGKRVFLITARTDNYQDETIKKIKEDTGLEIERYYFKPYSERVHLRAPEFKKRIALQLIEEGFKTSDFLGIESNAETRKAYKSIGIESMRYEKFISTIAEPELF